MKKSFTLIFLLFTIGLFAQPVNDDCSGIIDLGVVPYCPDTVFYTNVDATATDIGNDNIPMPGSCGDNDITFVGNDVWFQFTSSDTITDYTITVTGMDDGMGSTAMSNPQIMIYRGDCEFDGLALLACGSADDGELILELDVLDLDPGEIYYIRINDWSPSATPNWGSFLLCIDEIDPINTIDQDGSNACTGELYDTGGPDGDYGPNENHSFTICPPFGQNACVTFNLEYFNIENFNDELVFYDGPDTNSPVILDIDGSGFGSGGPNITGGGGVCLTVQASSGCLTVEFNSDGFTEFEGFAGFWECSATPCEPLQSIITDDDVTDQDIIDNITTPQTTVTIDTIICPQGAYGTFTSGDNSDLGLERGLILTSGSVFNTLGPNTDGGITQDNFAPGDDDLDYLSSQSGNGSLSQDACIVELDVFVATNELVFEYVFGSDEYPEWANSTFNDIFAFLISGPGITGDPNINNQENIAIIPGTTTPVQVNSINNINNWEYYRNNEAGLSVEYDGLTSDFLGIKKSLTARRDVTPCNTYHLKLAVADRGDGSLDSGVFISEIAGGTPTLTINFASGVDYLIEDCTGMDDELLITLSTALPDSTTYDVNISGTAVEGVDYILDIPDQVTIAPGETQLSFPIFPLSDGIDEGLETIVIELTTNFGCGDVQVSEVTVNLADAPIVDIFAGLDTAFVCNNECIMLEVNGAVDYFWEPDSILNDPFSASPEACPSISQFIYVTGQVSALPGCSDTDTIWLEVVDPQVDIVPLGDINFCQGSSVDLQAVNNVNNTNLEWTPADGLSSTSDEVVTASPLPGSTSYIATVTIAGCDASDTLTVNVDPFDFPTLTTTDTTICQGQSVQLANNIVITTTEFEWTPDEALSPANDVSGPLATPESTTTYTLIATSASEFCADTVDVNINVIPAEVTIMPEDTVFVCLGDTATLTATTTTNMVEWTPTNGLIGSSTDLSVDVFIEASQWYFATMTVGACTITDSVFVRVDSLPEMNILPIPNAGPFCPGEPVTFVSPPYEPNDYPDIIHAWAPGLGAESDLDNLNLVISAVETTTYVRTTTNNACSQTDEITIEVVDADDIMIAWTDTTLCEGEMVTNEVFNGDNHEWSPGTGLSCTECDNPTITATSTTTYTVSADIMGCPITGQVNVNVIPDASGSVIGDQGICPGDNIQLNLFEDTTPGTVYTWSSDPTDPDLDINEPLPVVSPAVTTTYSVIITNGICDPYEAEVTIFVIQSPTFALSPDETICAGDTIEISLITEDQSGSNTTWTGDDIISEDGNTISVNPSVTSVYTVNYADNCGNTFEGDITVNVIESINIDIVAVPDTTSLPQGSIVELTAVPDAPVNDPIYMWSNGSTGVTILDTLLEIPQETISVMLLTAEGCEADASITFDVEEPEYDIPNAFSPNGDNLSETFNVVFRGDLEVIEFKVFSRWGEIVYNNENPTLGWDGRKDDEDMPSDVYLYVIRLQNAAGLIIQEKGDVTLIR